jgi:hypothetical protein
MIDLRRLRELDVKYRSEEGLHGPDVAEYDSLCEQLFAELGKIEELYNTQPKLLAVVEAARQAALDCEDAGCELIADKLYAALAALEEEV